MPFLEGDANRDAVALLKRRPDFVVLCGGAATGKTRLIQEFAQEGDIILDPPSYSDADVGIIDGARATGKVVFVALPTSVGGLNCSDQLKSRLCSGVTITCRRADVDMRKQAVEHIYPECHSEVRMLIAARAGNMREAIGAASTARIYGETYGHDATGKIRTAIAPVLAIPTAGANLQVETIMDVVARRTGVSVEQICGRSRTKNQSFARHVVWYLARKLTPVTLAHIGRCTGDRDHTTILHGEKRIRNMVQLGDSSETGRIQLVENSEVECLVVAGVLSESHLDEDAIRQRPGKG